MFESGTINSNGEMNNIMKIVDSLDESGLLIKDIYLVKHLLMNQKNKKEYFMERYWIL